MKVRNLLKSGWITGKFKMNIGKQEVSDLFTGGAVCISETRVTLDPVMYAFPGGATAER